jgi:hypothetical protein
MGRSILATGLVAWALIGAPALCVAGLIRHPCESAGIACRTTVADCACDADPGDPESPNSSHEGDCDQDPCTGLVVRPESPEEFSQSGSAPIAMTETVRCDVALDSLVHTAHRAGPENFASPGHIHPSDLPLLL